MGEKKLHLHHLFIRYSRHVRVKKNLYLSLTVVKMKVMSEIMFV